ncbi:MAG: hypothetical protein J7M14_01540 [Planctomycetes bacterium]|nr:hypothetical protein [Planctomycetota bacterium]
MMTKVSGVGGAMAVCCMLAALVMMTGCATEDYVNKSITTMKASIDSDIAGVRNEVATVSAAVNANEAGISALSSKLDDLSGKLAALDVRMVEVEKLLALPERLDAAEASVKGHDKQLSDIQTAVMRNTTTISKMPTSEVVAQLRKTIDDNFALLTTKDQTLTDRDARLKEDILKVEKTLALAAADLSYIKKFAAKLDSRMDNVRGKVEDSDAVLVKVFTDEIAVLQERIKKLNAAVERISLPIPSVEQVPATPPATPAVETPAPPVEMPKKTP